LHVGLAVSVLTLGRCEPRRRGRPCHVRSQRAPVLPWSHGTVDCLLPRRGAVPRPRRRSAARVTAQSPVPEMDGSLYWWFTRSYVAGAGTIRRHLTRACVPPKGRWVSAHRHRTQAGRGNHAAPEAEAGDRSTQSPLPCLRSRAGGPASPTRHVPPPAVRRHVPGLATAGTAPAGYHPPHTATAHPSSPRSRC
jgi:hypothetical protein